jgi:hypothetical protein
MLIKKNSKILLAVIDFFEILGYDNKKLLCDYCHRAVSTRISKITSHVINAKDNTTKKNFIDFIA